MSKFSVKKPLTVFVAVVIVIVLSIVSYTRMTPDLLPNINTPYIVLMTTYPGAVPEKVETVVTKPLESAMGTLENIKTISSTSSENVSVVVLEFTDSADLDAATVDILQKINLITGYWDETVGTPTILKINPSMLPVMVAAVSMEGMENAALSAFVEDTVIPKLEGTAGIAEVTASGLLSESVAVTIDRNKIDALNEKIFAAIEEQFREGEEKLEEAKTEIDSNQSELESGASQMQAGREELISQLGGAEAEISAQQTKLQEGKEQIKEQIAELKSQLEEVNATETALTAIRDSINALEERQAELEASVSQLTELQETLQELDTAREAFELQMEAIRNNELLSEEEREAALAALMETEEYKQTVGGLAELEATLAAQGLTREDLETALSSAQEGLAAVQAGLSGIDETLSSQGFTRADVQQRLEEVQSGKEQLESAIEQLEATLEGLDSGALQLQQAMNQLETQKLNAIFQMSDAATQLALGQQQLTEAAAEVENGLTQLQEAKEAALTGADMQNVITEDIVRGLLTAQNFDMPAGTVKNGDGETVTVTVGDTIGSREELETLVLMDLKLDGVEPIRLCDVAEVVTVDNSAEIYAKINREDGILLSFSKQSNAATATASDALHKTFSGLEKQYPGLSFTTLMDQGKYIYIIVNSILQNILFGALFAVLILFFFLKDLKPTLITLCSIPLSLMFAVVLMYFSGVTLNMLSLSGLAVAVGMLVDNSVVVIENTYRLRAQGVSAVRAAVFGAKQMTGAIAASTLTTVCVFLPIVFVEGLTKDLFTDMALTLAYSLLASLIVALTLVPAMASRLMRNFKPRSHKIFDVFLKGYGASLRFVLRYKAPALIAAVLLLAGSFIGAFSRGLSFMPSVDTEQISVSVEMPEEATFAETAEAADQVTERVLAVDGVETVGAMISSGGTRTLFSGGSGSVSMYVMLEEDTDRSSGEIVKEINESCEDLVCGVNASDGSQMGSALTLLTGTGVSIQVYGNDPDALEECARDVASILNSVPGTENVSDGMENADPELHIVVDKKKAAENGLTVAQVYAAVSSALTDGNAAGSISEAGKSYSILLYDTKKQEITEKELEDLPISVTDQRTGEKSEVLLSQVAEVEKTQTLTSIRRQDQKRYLNVTASIAEGYNVSLVTEDARRILSAYDPPAGVEIVFEGENESIVDAMKQLVLMLGLGILLVYLVMVAQFQSLKSPFIVMFTIPLAFTGGLLALYLLGETVSVISLIGFVMLTGIIVNNGIVLVDYINQLRLAGREKREAIAEAGKTRMRPILMTSVTTVLGLMVTVLSRSEGAALMRPIAVVCIGGLVYATLMTLYIVPVIYDLFNRKEINAIRDAELQEGDDITDETVI